mmetsp:Transcript_26954/g.39863  ORF Transcript_26954/g.39863 Transcript_26954/m.39863 type:complete len:863 (+) Transcript_26954:447-3035(+)|eukprot:CAMPEP_0194219770 /NCGR_PEP_ID=MMETSP0156-20130528/26817_1 /TAXON_ID=33649 /ORGANISM="Thalassionema nitzschioides, Strain L26-B" /LENGTH=862 /DNA_ID=CAMNT_0038949563 /DNA_START=354 /DNA_END=2942 /DNA_ORIENTATION=-
MDTSPFEFSPPDEDRETGAGFYIFLITYTVFCITFIAPLVLWSNRYSAAHSTTLPAGFEVDLQSTRSVGEHPSSQAPSHQQNNTNTITNGSNHSKPQLIRRDIDRVVAQDEDGDSHSQFSTSLNGLLSIHRSQTSAATTSRLWTSTPKTQICDVGRRRWKQRRPIGRHIHQHYKEETASMGGSSYSRGMGSNQELVSINQRTNNTNMSKGHMMSDVASSILTEELEGPPIGANNSGAHRVIIHCQHHRRTVGAGRRFRRGSGSSRSMASSDQMLSAVNPDDISPNDAADAGDPGRVNSLQYVEQLERQRDLQRQEMANVCCGPAALWKPRTIMAAINGLIALSEPDMELQRIVAIGIPLTLGAMSTTFFHLVNSAFIANYISTDAMVAYVIVHLLLGLTKELVGSIADAQSTLCSHALSMGDWRLAGQYTQIAIIFIILINIPILFLWGNYMDSVVQWMVASAQIAKLAKEYTQVVLIWQLLLQGLSRSFTVLFHLTGHEAYETQCALGEAFLQMVVVTCVAGVKKEEASLGGIGGIQFILAAAFFIAKITNAVFRRWLRIFYVGMCRSCALWNFDAVLNLCRTTFPLLIGAFLEYGEWELLLFLVVALGPAEVATWAMSGTLWKLLEISTEGFGEAASIRVAYHLGTPGQEPLARLASQKALLVTTLQSLLLSSVLLMAGPQIARLLAPDVTLRKLFNELMTTLALANLVLHAAMTFWSLLGAQGRYRMATLIMLLTRYLVTMPMAALCIHAWNMDLNAVLGSITTGLSTSVLLLGYIFFRSDWERLAKIMQELNALLDVSEEEEEDDDDDDYGFGEDVVEEIDMERDSGRRQVPPLQASSRSPPEEFMANNLEERLEIPY